MTIFRVQHNKDYTVINNFICKDNRLSWKAKGIWLYAFSRPDDWEFYQKEMMSHSIDGEDSFRSGLKELEKYGYLVRNKKKDSQGKFSYDWTFHEKPIEIKEILPDAGFPDLDSPPLVNPVLLSTESRPSTETTTGDCSVVVLSEEREELLKAYDFNNQVRNLCKGYYVDQIRQAIECCKKSEEMEDHNRFFTSALKGGWFPKQSKEQIAKQAEEQRVEEEIAKRKQQQQMVEDEIIKLVKDWTGKLKEGYNVFIDDLGCLLFITPKLEKPKQLYPNKQDLEWLTLFIENYKK